MYCRKLHHNSTICCQSPTFRHHSQAYANNYSSNHIYILGHPPGFHPCPLLFGTQTFYLVKCIQPDVTNYQHPIILLMTIKSLICHTDLFPDTEPIFWAHTMPKNVSNIFHVLTLTFHIFTRQLFSSKFTMLGHTRIYQMYSFIVTFVPQNNIMRSVLFKLYRWKKWASSPIKVTE